MRCEMQCVAVHDDATYKPMLVFKIWPENERERQIMSRAGFGTTPNKQHAYTFFYDLNHNNASYGAYKLEDQCTCGTAAKYISRDENFSSLEPGDFLDCEYLRGEKDTPMTFEEEFDYTPGKTEGGGQLSLF